MNTTPCLNHKAHRQPCAFTARWGFLICLIVLSLLRVPCDANVYMANYIGTRNTPTYGGTTSGGGYFSPGSAKTLTATPASGYAFENWTDEAGNVVSTSASFIILPGNYLGVVAHFTLIGGGGGDWRALSVTVSPGTVPKGPGDPFDYVATVVDGWGEPVSRASVFLKKPDSWPVPPPNGSITLGSDLFVISGGVFNPTNGNGQFTLGSAVPVGTASGTYTLEFSASKQGYTSAATSAQIQILAPSSIADFVFQNAQVNDFKCESWWTRRSLCQPILKCQAGTYRSNNP